MTKNKFKQTMELLQWNYSLDNKSKKKIEVSIIITVSQKNMMR